MYVRRYIRPMLVDKMSRTCKLLEGSWKVDIEFLGTMVSRETVSWVSWFPKTPTISSEETDVFLDLSGARWHIPLCKLGQRLYCQWSFLKMQHRGAWVAQSVKRPTLARSRSRGPWVQAPRRALGWWLRAWSLFPILCLPLSLPLPRSCSVSLCPKNK